MKQIAVAFAVIYGLLVSSMSLADTMRCGNKLVFDGDSMYTVKSTCGEPDDAQHRTEIRTFTHEVSEPCATPQQHARCSRSVETSVEVAIDEWTYDFGSSQFIETLRFEDGKLVRITDGGYGKKVMN